MTALEQLRELAASHLSAAVHEVSLEPLTGGLINHVYRATAGTASLIVKHAEPHVAAVPSIALSPRRLAVEARCLRELGPGGRLASVESAHVRAPRLIAHAPVLSTVVIEDLGALPDLSDRVCDVSLVGELGQFIARLHGYAPDDLLDSIINRDVQFVRQQTQYEQVESWLADLGRADHAALGRVAVDLGRRWLGRGRAVIMGDLWLRSLLVAPSALYVIDWELAHAGEPAQDLGHLLAHLWMHEQRVAGRAAWFREARRRFIAAYTADRKLEPESIGDACCHAGCEILARVVGPFRAGYLYAEEPRTSDSVRFAVETACRALAGDGALWTEAI